MTSRSRIRVAILRHGPFPQDPRVYKEAKALAECGCDVVVLCLRNSGEKKRELTKHFQIYRQPFSHRRGSRLRYVFEYTCSLINMGLKITSLALSRRFDLIQVNTLPDFLVFAAIFPKMLGTRVLLDLHEPTPELYLTIYGEKASALMNSLIKCIERWAIRFSHHAITVNDTIRRRFMERGAPKEKISVLRNVPDDDLFAIPKERNDLDSSFLIMTHGTMQPRYGQEILIRALPFVHKAIPQIRLRIVGGGESEGHLRKLAASSSSWDRIEFVGWVPLKNVAKVLIQADVGVVPLLRSPFSELCQPNKLFEYIALRVPVIAARFPAIEENFDNESVRYFEPDDPEDLARAIIAHYRNLDEGRAMADRALAKYQSLRWCIAKQDYIKIIEKLVGRSL